jgi:hypothetical protein
MKTVLFLFAVLCASLAGAADRVSVGAFSTGNLDGWTAKIFSGETEYAIVENQGRRVLRAVSRATASGMYKRVQVDLTKTPYLHWSWEVENTLGALDETVKAGDDYPARVYVIASGGIFFWQTRAVNYVWANRQPQGAVWPNAFTASNRMIAVRSGDSQLGRWLDERRNVREDFRRVFGRDVLSVDAVALMSDSDNSGKAAVAHYGDIYFSAD